MRGRTPTATATWRCGSGRFALAVSAIEVTFGAVRAVDGVDLHVEPGEVVGVVGANGAGKTTLIDAITGFVPSAGTVDFGGQDLAAAVSAPHGRGQGSRARGRAWS